MKPTLETLIQRVLAGGFLSPGEIILLQHLHRHPRGVDEAEIAKELLKDPNWDPRRGTIRVAIHRLRGELRTFFNYLEGKHSDFRLDIPRGTPYRIEVIKNVLHYDPIERFWDAHFNNGAPNLIISTEPLFFWDQGRRCFVRYLDINDESASLDAGHIRDLLPPNHPARELTPCFHYQPSGDANACQKIRAWFQQQDGISVKFSRDCTDREVLGHNLIVLGNNRTNKYLRTLQKGLGFSLGDDRIIVQGGKKKRRREYFDLKETPDDKAGRYVYAVVTRRPSLVNQRCATIIGGNHGRAVEKVAEYLTTEQTLDGLYRWLGLSPEAELPSQFQLLFRIQTVDFELAPAEAEPEDAIMS
jgi:hypothetical protein